MTAATRRLGTLAVAALVVAGGSAAAQTMSGLPNALQGFSINREKPVQITSTTLEVRDKEKRATFIGNVLVAQGDTTMKSKTLDVYYEQQEANSSDGKSGEGKTAQTNGSEGKAAQTGGGEGKSGQAGGSQQIRRLEAKGGVVVTQKEQTATGETGVFDMRTNTVMLVGGVVITQGPQVIRGEKLTVDLTTGVSHVEGGVQGLFMPNRVPKAGEGKNGEGKNGESKNGEARGTDAKSGEARAADSRSDSRSEGGRSKDGSKPSAKSAPGQPLRLN
jgi:lipopolysaccharide export system protein LptA